VTKVLIPALSPDDWKQFLADPEKQWKTGYSARSMAYCWQEADGIPQDVAAVLNQSPTLQNIEAIFVIPEHKVPLPGGSRESQNDAWVLAQCDSDLVSIAVEGKVSEPFGDLVGDWFANPSKGKETRLKFLCDKLGVTFPPPNDVRYQLFHRTVSAILEAERFNANHAVMVVHTFSPTNEWLDEYQQFLALLSLEGGVDEIVTTTLPTGMKLHFAWVHGNEKYLHM